MHNDQRLPPKGVSDLCWDTGAPFRHPLKRPHVTHQRLNLGQSPRQSPRWPCASWSAWELDLRGTCLAACSGTRTDSPHRAPASAAICLEYSIEAIEARSGLDIHERTATRNAFTPSTHSSSVPVFAPQAGRPAGRSATDSPLTEICLILPVMLTQSTTSSTSGSRYSSSGSASTTHSECASSSAYLALRAQASGCGAGGSRKQRTPGNR